MQCFKTEKSRCLSLVGTDKIAVLEPSNKSGYCLLWSSWKQSRENWAIMLSFNRQVKQRAEAQADGRWPGAWPQHVSVPEQPHVAGTHWPRITPSLLGFNWCLLVLTVQAAASFSLAEYDCSFHLVSLLFCYSCALEQCWCVKETSSLHNSCF